MSCSPPRRLSPDCGYSTCPSSSSDDDLPSRSFEAGFCPHCHQLFEEPLTLQCGHSLCSGCVGELLAKENVFSTTTATRRSRIRMGLRSCAMQLHSLPEIVYRSPGCVVCAEPPKLCPPVPNLELKLLLRSLPKETSLSFRNLSKMSKSALDFEEDTTFTIRDCKIALVGGRGVGKSSLKRMQYGNDIVFTDILGKRQNGEDDAIDDAFMIDIVDGDNSDSDLDGADGFVLVYSITDRDSLRSLPDIHEELTLRRGPRVPMVLVGAKADQRKRRCVQSFEGQSLAREFGCPFLEVSAKKNDGVNEAFVELARIVEYQRCRK